MTTTFKTNYTQKQLEKLFDNADLNGVLVSHSNHPYFNGQRVTVIKRTDLDLNIMERADTNKGGSLRYSYAVISDDLASRIDEIEKDPYDDLSYSLNLLDIGNNVFNGHYSEEDDDETEAE